MEELLLIFIPKSESRIFQLMGKSSAFSLGMWMPLPVFMMIKLILKKPLLQCILHC